jgi:hypothetical protein
MMKCQTIETIAIPQKPAWALHATLALAGSTRDDQLTDAIATRDVIGQPSES